MQARHGLNVDFGRDWPASVPSLTPRVVSSNQSHFGRQGRMMMCACLSAVDPLESCSSSTRWRHIPSLQRQVLPHLAG